MRAVLEKHKIGHINIEITQYHGMHIINGLQLLSLYFFVLEKYSDQCERENSQIEFIDFLMNYINNGIFKESKFILNNGTINFENTTFLSIGEFYINNCRINVNGSYMFLEDTKTKKQYFYYTN